MALSNTELANKISNLIQRWQTYLDEKKNWLAGSADGGPNNDGTYPLTDAEGNTEYYESIPKIQQEVSDVKSDADTALNDATGAKTASEDAEKTAAEYATLTGDTVTDYDSANGDTDTGEESAKQHANYASTSASNAATSESNAQTAESGAQSAESSAISARDAAQTAESGAQTAESNAQAHEVDAGEHETTARRYAVEGEDVTVVDADTGNDTGEYSAKHYAKKAQGAASGSMYYKGDWDASTGSYPSESQTQGNLYFVSVSGTVDGVEYNVSDMIVYNGGDSTLSSGWDHIDSTDRVTSVAGKTGSVTLDHNNDLNGLQGGTTGERYHLTSAEHSSVQNLKAPAEDAYATTGEHETGTATDLVANPEGVKAHVDSRLAANGGTVPEVDQNEKISGIWNYTNPNPIRIIPTNVDGRSFQWQIVDTSTIIQGGGWGSETTKVLQQRFAGFSGSENLFGTAWTRFDGRTLLAIDADEGVIAGDVVFQGSGTLNAEGLYENGNRVSTTDYVFDALIDGQIDTDWYDRLLDDEVKVESDTETEPVEEEVTETVTTYRDEWDVENECYRRCKHEEERPVVDEYPVMDDEGNEIDRKRVPRKQMVHRPKQVNQKRPGRFDAVHRFEHDDLDPDTYGQKMRDCRRLPAMDRLMNALREGQDAPSMGQWVQAVLETCEVQAVHIERLQERVKNLEGQS